MPGPFTTPVALSTPFQKLRNPGFGGVAQSFTSEDVQNAIEESLARAIANDRYLLLCNYNGNAGVGRYLEFFSGIDSSAAPIFQPNASSVQAIVAATTSANATCDIGFFDLTVSSVTPVYTVTFTNQKRVVISGLPVFTLAANAQLALQVTSGSINKPHVYFSMSAST